MRPVSIACRDGEHRAVVWKRLYFSPFAASFSKLGVRQGPPNALEAPNPTSSSSTIKMLGAPFGGRRSRMGGNLVSGSRASYVVSPTYGWSGMGSVVLEIESCGVILEGSHAPSLTASPAMGDAEGHRGGLGGCSDASAARRWRKTAKASVDHHAHTTSTGWKNRRLRRALSSSGRMRRRRR